MAHVIDKTFEFAYGHRVWTQQLNGEYAADLKCACRHLHGHEGKMQVYLKSPSGQLDPTGMVTDFRHLEWLKKWINTYIDHQFVIDKIYITHFAVINSGLPGKIEVCVFDGVHVSISIRILEFSKLAGFK